MTATALVERMFPGREPRRLEGGWTSDTFEVDGWIVQVARSAYASETLRHQVRVVPRLAPHLATAIPRPELVCDEPTAIRYRKLEGRPCGEAVDGAWPEQLGGVLRSLHGLEPGAIGLDRVGPEHLRERQRVTCDRLRACVVQRLESHERAAAEALLDAILDERHWRFTPVITHSDLGPEHVLIDSAGNLVGVIDWEEVGAGNPVGDFAWWMHAMPEVGARMLRGYGGTIGDGFRERARLSYALMPWHEVEHGVGTNDAACIASGLAGVRARMP